MYNYYHIEIKEGFVKKIARKILMTSIFLGMTGANYIFLPPEAATVLGVNLLISGYFLWRPFKSGFSNFTSFNSALDIVKSLNNRHKQTELSSENNISRKFHHAFQNTVSNSELERALLRKINYINQSQPDTSLHNQQSSGDPHKESKNPSC